MNIVVAVATSFAKGNDVIEMIFFGKMNIAEELILRIYQSQIFPNTFIS